MSTLDIALILSSRWPWRARETWRRLGGLGLGIIVGLISGCRHSAIATPRQIIVQQAWELEPGQQISGFGVVASLGDISIDTRGHRIYAPFTGEVELAALGNDCIFFSSAEVPAYLFRYCGVRRPRLGPITLAAPMGSARFLHFSTLRRQPDGTWAMVEPSRHVLERSLRAFP